MEKYEPLKKTAEIIGMGEGTLRKYAHEGAVPCLDITRGKSGYKRFIFQPSRVLAALRELETKTA